MVIIAVFFTLNDLSTYEIFWTKCYMGLVSILKYLILNSSIYFTIENYYLVYVGKVLFFFLILKYTFSRNVSLTESVCWLFGVDYHHKITETAIFLLPGIGMFFRRWIISDTQHISDCFELWRVVEEKRLCQKNCGLLKSRSLRCSTVITSPPRYQLERPIISRSENLILVGS